MTQLDSECAAALAAARANESVIDARAGLDEHLDEIEAAYHGAVAALGE